MPTASSDTTPPQQQQHQRSDEAENVPQVSVKWYDHYVEQELPDLTGKVAIVTGANSGTGYWAARALAVRNCHVVLACRNMEKAQTAKEEILRVLTTNSNSNDDDDDDDDDKNKELPNVDCLQLDNMDFSSVQSFAEKFNQKYDRLDFLLNNAGIMAVPKEQSKDGHDVQLQTNHLAHFLLTKLLWKKMLATDGKSMIVHHASMTHRLGSPVFDPNHLEDDNTYSWGLLGLNSIFWNVLFPIGTKGNAGNFVRYGVSKLCNILFMKELSRKINDKGLQDNISTAACHPGYASTQLQYKARDSMFFWKGSNRFAAQSAADGSLPLLMAAIHGENGKYYGPKYVAMGLPVEDTIGGNGNNEQQAKDLWEYSESATGGTFEI